MLGTQKAIVVSALLAGWLVYVPFGSVPAAEPGETADRLQKIERQVQDLQTAVDDLKNTVSDLTRQLNRLAKDLPLTTTQVQQSAREINALRESVSRLQRDLAEAPMNRSEPRIARSFSEPAATGRIQLINQWLTPLSVVIDGISYPLLPNETRAIVHSPGAFNYEVLGVQPMQTRSLLAGETFTIRIGPR